MGKKYDVYGVGNALVDIEYEVCHRVTTRVKD